MVHYNQVFISSKMSYMWKIHYLCAFWTSTIVSKNKSLKHITMILIVMLHHTCDYYANFDAILQVVSIKCKYLILMQVPTYARYLSRKQVGMQVGRQLPTYLVPMYLGTNLPRPTYLPMYILAQRYRYLHTQLLGTYIGTYLFNVFTKNISNNQVGRQAPMYVCTDLHKQVQCTQVGTYVGMLVGRYLGTYQIKI